MPTRSLSEVIRGLAQHPEGFAGVFRRMGYTPLLPLLELPYSEVTAGLWEAFRASGLGEEDFKRVSLHDLVAYALGSKSNYWAGLAVRWLADGFSMNEAVVRAGSKMVEVKRGTQADRHIMVRLIRRYEPGA